jgi:cytoskeletal protein CcmA (bactofilin family)
MAASTNNYGFPYPQDADTVDVAGDIQSLAEDIDSKLSEAIADTLGTMVTSNTESGITVTYDDADNTLDFDVADFTLTFLGDVSGSASITNLASASATITIAPNSVALGTDTTGNYVATAAAGSGIDIAGSGSETAALTITNTGVTSLLGTADQVAVSASAGAVTLSLPSNVTLTGVPAAPTAALGTNTTQIATTAFVKAETAALIDSAPATLDTLNELAAALGDDANFATTISTYLGNKANTASPTFTGTVSLPSATSIGSITDTEISYLDGVTSSIQTQLNSKQLNFTGYDNEIHVSQVDGNDTTGNGDLLTPVASITKALTFITGQRKTIVIHPGGYSESPSITTQYTVLTTYEPLGGNTAISGTVSASVGCTIAGLTMTNLTITAGTGVGVPNIINSNITGTLTKSGNATFTDIHNCNIGTAANITGSGLVTINDGNPNFVTVNNSSATVTIKNAMSCVAPTLTAGTLNIVDSIVISAVTNAVTSSASSIITLANSQFLNSALTGVAPVVLNGFYSILNCVYDKPNSTLVASSGTGGTTNSIDYFQYINADKFITQGGASAQYVKGDGSLDSVVYAPIASPTLTGVPAAPTAALGTDTTQIATTAFVKAETNALTNSVVTSLLGTADEVTVSASAGAVTLSLPTTINANTTGTAAALTTPRTIALTGDVTGSVSFDGSASASIATTVVNGGGGGVTSLLGTADEVTVSASAGAVTISLPATINANTTGTAAALTTARTIALTGDVTGSVSFDGSASASIATTVVNGGGGGVTSLLGTADEVTVSASAGAVTLSLPATINANTTGTAAALTTARTIELTGDVTGTLSFDGSASASMATTIAANSVALGTDTTGNYVATAAAGSGIEVSGSGSETAALTITNTGVTSLAGTADEVTVSASAGAVTLSLPSTISQNKITNLTSDLSAKAPLSSPTFTGVPAAPTATAGTSTTQLATTAFVSAAVSAGGGGSSATIHPMFIIGGV